MVTSEDKKGLFLPNAMSQKKRTSYFLFFVILSLKYLEMALNWGPKTIDSSVWVVRSSAVKRYSFKNLFYNENYKFMFALGDGSTVSGLNTASELQFIDTSSVSNHSNFFLPLSTVPSDSPILRNIIHVNDRIFLLSRFKPDNIMHVIHDDLLPTFYTFKQMCLGRIEECVSTYRLLFTDVGDSDLYNNWYSPLSWMEPLHLSHFKGGVTYCFSHVTIGLSTDTLLYQYGFGVPHGALHSQLIGPDLKEFREIYLNRFHIHPSRKEFSITLISRNSNRKILNEDFIEQVAMEVAEKHKRIKSVFHKIDLSTNTTEQLLRTISQTQVLIGMHGAATFLSVFLPNNSTCVELFPYGIVGSQVSAVHSMSKVPGVHFKYFSWTANDESLSIPHPENPPLLGGVLHLTPDEQSAILNAYSVPPVECCHHPLYLYRMFQDTIVDDSIRPILDKAVQLSNYPAARKTNSHTWYFPSWVQNLMCQSNSSGLSVRWEPPFNLGWAAPLYNVSVAVGSKVYNLVTSLRTLSVKINVDDGIVPQVWVCCMVGSVRSSDQHVYCEIPSTE